MYKSFLEYVILLYLPHSLKDKATSEVLLKFE